jgi:hypothetical protein
MNAKGLIWASLIGLACATTSASAEEANSAATPSIIGFIDAQTGVIKPLMTTTTTASPEAAATGTLHTGELKITGTITIVSPSISSTTPVNCTATGVVPADGNGPITETASSPAARSGATATCTVLVPYEWLLQTPTTDKVTLSVSVSALSASARVHTRQLATFVVPANGTTTSFTFVGHL